MSCLSIAVPVVLSIIAIIIVITVPLALKFWSPSKVAETVPQLGLNMTSNEFINSLDNFGVKLFSELAQSNSDKNLFFSPFSIQTCLTMTRMGAEGQTAIEMDNGLDFSDKNMESVANNYNSLLAKYENGSLLTIANKIYVMQHYTVQDDFNKTMSTKFFSSAASIDFSQKDKAASAMNNWVETKTQNAIKNLVSPGILNGDTRVFLLSAIHFKGEWAITFPSKETTEQDFYTNEKDAVKVQMMYKKNLYHYNTFPDLDASAVRLLYKDSDLSMLIFLPNSRVGLAGMLEKLKKVKLEDITKEMRARTYVQVYLPKFKVEFEAELKDVLMKLGMQRMFSSAEFGKMLKSNEPLQVSNVIHKAFIEVNEKGTEAAAATGVAVTTRDGGGLQSLRFRAEHPFYYIIMNSDNVRLFEGTFIGV